MNFVIIGAMVLLVAAPLAIDTAAAGGYYGRYDDRDRGYGGHRNYDYGYDRGGRDYGPGDGYWRPGHGRYWNPGHYRRGWDYRPGPGRFRHVSYRQVTFWRVRYGDLGYGGYGHGY